MSSSEKPSSKGQAWFCTTGLPSDIVVEVDDMTFHLHKFPLMSKSRKLHDLITQQEAEAITQSTVPQDEDDEDEIVEEQCHVTFTDFPGGSEAFEMAAKFCYGVKMELSPSNVASLCCACEFLDMTKEYSEDNLISKTEKFISQYMLKRCIDSVISSASSADPALFGWPVTEAIASASKQILWNGIDASGRRNGAAGESWFEDLALLRLPLFKRLILAMKDEELNPEIIETCVMYYAKKYIPGVSRSSRKPLSSSSSVLSETEQKEILEQLFRIFHMRRI